MIALSVVHHFNDLIADLSSSELVENSEVVLSEKEGDWSLSYRLERLRKARKLSVVVAVVIKL